jgi:hypothetical protein
MRSLRTLEVVIGERTRRHTGEIAEGSEILVHAGGGARTQNPLGRTAVNAGDEP